MSLADLIKKRPARLATAIPATSAIREPTLPASVAGIATIAVASPLRQELFVFNPPESTPNDDEALQERVAITMEGNCWDATRALQEARWATDKERCWSGFLLNAKCILDNPRHQLGRLLARYRTEAINRYGENAGAIMTEAMSDWVTARRVH